MRKKIIIVLPALVLLAASLTGCIDDTPVKSAQADKAKAAANSLNFTANSEIDNITRRLKLTSNPGQVGFILLLNQSGQPIAYYGVKGKITSSGKRLTSPEECSSGSCYTAPSDEGTYGTSDPYIYFWDENGAYRQWSGEYLYSDKPFRITIKPLIISDNASTSNTNGAAVGAVNDDTTKTAK